VYTYDRQKAGKDDIDAVVEVLLSRYLTQSPVFNEFELALGRKLGALHGSSARRDRSCFNTRTNRSP